MDGFDGGFAIGVGGGFIVMAGIIAAVIYFRLAASLDRILLEKNILAHWTYTPEEWKIYTEIEHKEDAAAKRGLFFMIAIISVIVGIIFFAVERENPLIIALIVLGIIAIAGLAAFFSTLGNYLNNKKHLGEVYISIDGVYLNRQVHVWNCLGNLLEEISYDSPKNQSPRIILTYSAPAKNGRNSYTVRIPIPPGQETAAKNIINRIGKTHLQLDGNNI
jgi:uncharacterized membrane protein